MTDGTLTSEYLKILSSYAGRQILKSDFNLKIVDDLGLDSFAVVEMIYELELKLNMKISNDELRSIKSVRDMSKLIEDRCANGKNI